jgi:glutaredoxin
MAHMIEVLVYSKPDCCLCDDVKAQLTRLGKTCRFEWREVNILGDPQAFEQFKEEIPVVFINGEKSFKYHLDEKEFMKRLEILSSSQRSNENAT